MDVLTVKNVLIVAVMTTVVIVLIQWNVMNVGL